VFLGSLRGWVTEIGVFLLYQSSHVDDKNVHFVKFMTLFPKHTDPISGIKFTRVLLERDEPRCEIMTCPLLARLMTIAVGLEHLQLP